MEGQGQRDLPTHTTISICDMFQPLTSVHVKCTRQCTNKNLYVPPRAKLNVHRNSIRYSGAKIWNSLPTELRSAPSISCFKQRYFRWYFDRSIEV